MRRTQRPKRQARVVTGQMLVSPDESILGQVFRLGAFAHQAVTHAEHRRLKALHQFTIRLSADLILYTFGAAGHYSQI